MAIEASTTADRISQGQPTSTSGKPKASPVAVSDLPRLLDAETPNPPYEISQSDPMYKDPGHYDHVGKEALRAISLAMLAARKQTVERILDFPCGHGRVLRMLKWAFPDARLTACDLDREGVDFCVKVLGAEGVYSKENPSDLEIEADFDLIWCGSLFTHLNASRWDEFLALFESLLIPGGLLVFTVSGRRASEKLRVDDLADRPPNRKVAYGLFPGQIEALLRDYDRDGFGYVDYSHATNYGISLASPAWVCRQLERLPNLYLLTYAEECRDPPQSLDVVSCIRRA
jgi:SAM-dependent methyltransferase